MADSALDIAGLFSIKHIKRGDAFLESLPSARWHLDTLLGRLVEITASGAVAALTAAMGLVREAQQNGENPVWMTDPGSAFFPPDVAGQGVDLDALTIVRVPMSAMTKTADKLARSGAFGLMVIDMAPSKGAHARSGRLIKGGDAWLSRLLGLAQKHDVAMVFLTRRDTPYSSLGTLVSLRGEARRTRTSPDRFDVEVRVVKDKRRAPFWHHLESCCGPVGLR